MAVIAGGSRLRAWLLGLAATCLAMAAVAAPAVAQQPVQGTPAAVDGAGIVRPSGLGLSIARDGSGGLIYLKQAGGVPHVFVSALVGGAFQTPIQVDTGLPGGSSQPVIAAGNGGVLLVGFINGGALYVADRAGQATGFGSPTGLAGGATNPAISMTNFGKAYLAFTAAAGGGYNVRAAYYANGRWALETPALNAVPGDDAGTGAGRPDVAAAGDGVAIVVWGENGHVYSRRVWATSPSVVDEQADAPPRGCTESSADAPVVGAGGDSSFAPVALRETVSCGGGPQSRVLVNRLHASVYDGITNADGLSGTGADGATDPQIAMTEYGQGWVTSERTGSDAVFAQTLLNNGQPGGTNQVNSLPATAAPDPVPAPAGLYSTAIAWQQQPGASAPSEIRLRYAPAGSGLGPEDVLSTPAQGPVDAADGLAVAGDVAGDVAVAWLQGAPGSTDVMVEQLYQAPGGFAAQATRYARRPQPGFSWTRPKGWGPMKYSLIVDGATVNQTYATSAPPATPLADGRHTWQVVASNPAGQQSRTNPVSVFIDTLAPRAKLTVPQAAALRTPFRLKAGYSDAPPAGAPRSDASGVSRVTVRWGDGSSTRLKPGIHLADHVYRKTGRYRITLLVTDRAGNVTRVVKRLKVVRSLPRSARKAKPAAARRRARGPARRAATPRTASTTPTSTAATTTRTGTTSTTPSP
jgi:hypothetical protein